EGASLGTRRAILGPSSPRRAPRRDRALAARPSGPAFVRAGPPDGFSRGAPGAVGSEPSAREHLLAGVPRSLRQPQSPPARAEAARRGRRQRARRSDQTGIDRYRAAARRSDQAGVERDHAAA